MAKYQLDHSTRGGPVHTAYFATKKAMLHFINDLLSSEVDNIVIKVKG